MFRGLCIALLALLATMDGAHGAPAIADFTRFGEYESLALSPNGQRVAITRRSEEHEILLVYEVDTLELLSNTTFGERTHIDTVFWISDDRLLVQPATLFPAFADGYLPTGEIIGLDADGSRVKVLFGIRARRTRAGPTTRVNDEKQYPGRVVDVLPDDDEHVIVQSYGWDIRGEYNFSYRMNVNSGRLYRLHRSPIRNGTFLTGTDHEIALVYGTTDDDLTAVYSVDEAGETELLRTGGLVPMRAWPDADADGNARYLVVEQLEGTTEGLALWTPSTGVLESIASHPLVNVEDWLSDEDGHVFAVGFVDHFPTWMYPDPEHPLARIHASLRAANPGTDVRLYSVSDDGSRAVAYIYGPQRPGRYLVVDVTGASVLRQLATRPWHAADQLSEVSPFEVTARDGLVLRGYLTEPAGAVSGTQPLVVLVHGGPHGVYDTWGFDSEAQLLAAHGYSVLQVNFRGSGGRGQSFEEAGYGAWGAEMQDDVTDAVRWAIASGAADPERICIMGGSYGAYAALTGAFREPGMFRCAIGIAGVYDLELMFQRGDIRTAMHGQTYLEKVLGDDREALRARSPVHNAEAVEAAVLLAHGDLDERAPIEHAHRMRRALRKAGNAPVWIRQRQEGHGFFEEENRRQYYAEVLSFLDAHIGTAAARVAQRD